MSNGPIIDLVAKGLLDEDIMDSSNKTSIFNFDISKKNKYAKGDSRFYPIGKANWGNTFRINIEKKGDLLYGLYLIVKLPKLSINNLNVLPKPDENDTNSIYRLKYSDFIGNILIEKISLYMNGQLIDEQTGEYMQVYTDLYLSDWNRKAMLGLDNINPNLKVDSELVYIPLKFWFCNEPYKPLPVIALQYTDIYIDVKFRKFQDCVLILEKNNNNLYHSNKTHIEIPIEEVSLQANFYYLELEERKKLALKEYEILITQSQLRSTIFNSTTSLLVDFNHIIKDMFFFIHPNKNINNGEYFNFSTKLDYPSADLNPLTNFELWDLTPQKHLLQKARLLFNGAERIEWRDAKYFYRMQNHENYKNKLDAFIYLYSFTVDPTRYTNSSGCNFSRIDNPQLQVEIKPDTVYNSNDTYTLSCYATNFNILIIKNGLVGLKYNN
jgi:hypothetical protein